MKAKVELVVRILMGLMYVVFGLNKFLHFIPMPEMPEAEAKYLGALQETGFMIPVIGLMEVVAGALFLAGRYVGLAAIAILPITVNIFLTHLFLGIEGIPVVLFLLAVNVYLLIYRKEQLSGLLLAK